MSFVRKVVDSNSLADIIDIPNELKNKKVEIIILPYENVEQTDTLKKSLKGVLAKHKNKELQKREKEAWKNAVVEKHENR